MIEVVASGGILTTQGDSPRIRQLVSTSSECDGIGGGLPPENTRGVKLVPYIPILPAVEFGHSQTLGVPEDRAPRLPSLARGKPGG